MPKPPKSTQEVDYSVTAKFIFKPHAAYMKEDGFDLISESFKTILTKGLITEIDALEVEIRNLRC